MQLLKFNPKILRTRYLSLPLVCLAAHLYFSGPSVLPGRTGQSRRLNSAMSQHDRIDLVRQLEAASPTIERLREISGNAGISLGVLHHGDVIYQANFGYRDVKTKASPDSDTVFPIASMTKALVASAFASLVEDGKLEWDIKLSKLVPDFRSLHDGIKRPELITDANLIDLLAHRLGITQGNNFWSEKNQVVLIDKKETAKIIGTFEPLAPFRSKFMYNNWAYGLAGEMLEDLTNTSLENYFQHTLFQPLGMSRTTLAVPDDNNYAMCYMALSNATPWKIPPTAYVSGKARAGAGACKSSVNDLLKLYKAWLDAGNDQRTEKASTTDGSPFKRVVDTWTSHADVNADTGYGLGWCLTKVPVIYHQGSVSGSLSAIHLLPETSSAIVALGNSFDLSDTPDWISQLLLEVVLAAPEQTDFVTLATATAANALSHHQPTIDKLAKEQVKGTKARPLAEYCGRYYNSIGNFFLEITEFGDGLKLSPNGFEGSSYILKHYNYDVVVWPCNRDAESKEGLYPQPAIGLHKVAFSGEEGNDKITQCNWQIDKAVPGGETFVRRVKATL